MSSRLEVPITNAPACFATCTAAEPIPLPTELTSTVSPARSFARVISMCQAVPKAMLLAAASTSLTPSGIRISCDALHVDLLGVAAARAHADEPVRRGAERLAAGAAVEAIAARRDQVDGDPVADLPPLDALAERRDPPDRLDAERVRELDREARDAFANVDVEVVERRRRDVHHDLVDTGRRVGKLLDPKHVGLAELVEDDGLQGLAPLSGAL